VRRSLSFAPSVGSLPAATDYLALFRLRREHFGAGASRLHQSERACLRTSSHSRRLPLAAAVVFTGIHTWFGLQVLRRNVVFADLALAQISALGATVAVVAGHPLQSAARIRLHAHFHRGRGRCCSPPAARMARSVRQEAFIGRAFMCFATAAAVLVVDRSPQGAEHVKKMLVGGILSVTADELVKFVAPLQHHRHPSLAIAATSAGPPQRMMRGAKTSRDSCAGTSFSICRSGWS